MAGVAERVFNYQLSGGYLEWVDAIKLGGQGGIATRVTSIAITCMTISANPLLIGWNEDAGTQDYLLPGDSYEVCPAEGNYLDGNELRFKFGSVSGPADYVDGQNTALVKIKFENPDVKIC